MEKLPVVNAFKPGVLKTKITDATQAYFNGTDFINIQASAKETIKIEPKDFISFVQTSGATHREVLSILMSTDSDNIICIYHGGCPDGVASAIVVVDALGSDVKLIPGHYARPLTDEKIDLEGKTVLLCDFSYQSDEMSKIASLAKQVIFLDHHDTALKKNEEVLEKDNVFAYASTHYCGASLTYQFFHPNKDLPIFIKYIQDGDLYEFKLDNSRAIVKGFHAMLNIPPADGVKLLQDHHVFAILDDVVLLGSNLNAASEREAKYIIKTARRTATAYGHTFPLINATPDHTNLVCELIYENEDVPFVMIYTILSDKVKLSLRSKVGAVNVSNLCKEIMNGGGHVNASAGFMPLDKFLSEVLVSSHAYKAPEVNSGLCACC